MRDHAQTTLKPLGRIGHLWWKVQYPAANVSPTSGQACSLAAVGGSIFWVRRTTAARLTGESIR